MRALITVLSTFTLLLATQGVHCMIPKRVFVGYRSREQHRS
jgi:hypothetical protein